MKVFVVVGFNKKFKNVSARAVFLDREEASKFVLDPKRNWFDDESQVVGLELDEELEEGSAVSIGYSAINLPFLETDKNED